jgi:sec-independent protein translocase protein TatB
MHQSVATEIHQTGAELEKSWNDATGLPGSGGEHEGWTPPPPEYRHPKKNWRLKRGATPQWYKQRAGVRVKAQSGAARVARFRPPRASA